MVTIPASVFILTYNSEQDIEATLRSVELFDDIVVVDSGSTDSTLAVLDDFSVRLFKQSWLGYADQKSFAMQQCRYDWVFNLDSDEVADQELLDFIANTVSRSDCSAVKVRIREHFIGMQTHAWTRHSAKIRVFKKANAQYSKTLAHEGVLIPGKVINADGYIHHYGEKSIAIKMNKINNYSCLKAEESISYHWLWLFFRIVFSFPIAFFRSYFLRRQCFNGVRGFVAAMMNGFYAFLKQSKSYERHVINSDS